jgi:hypothetical protein
MTRSFEFFLIVALTLFGTVGHSQIADDEPAGAASPKLAPRMGHNVSSTSYLMDKWQCTAGIQVAGCGLTKNWTVGTVPWLYFNYNMYSVVNRVRLKTYDSGGTWTAQLSYFKTFPQARNSKYLTYPYEMEAYWLQWIRSIPMAKHYRIYANIHTNYYANDKRPFSVRRPIPNRNAGQINLTTLHEVALYKRWFMLAEIGLLEILQPAPPYAHLGFSVGRSGITYEWHLGFTMTSTPIGLFNPRSRRDYQQELRDTERGFNQYLDREKTKRDYAIHPEFSLQYFF